MAERIASVEKFFAQDDCQRGDELLAVLGWDGSVIGCGAVLPSVDTLRRAGVDSWSDVPFLGDVTGPLSRVLDVPVVLTLFSVVNYGILILAFRKATEGGEDLGRTRVEECG